MARVPTSAITSAARTSSSRKAWAPSTWSSRSPIGSARDSRNSRSRTGNRLEPRSRNLRRLLQAALAGTCLAALSAGLSSTAMAAEKEVDKLSPTVVRDLHFGDALFYYFQ